MKKIIALLLAAVFCFSMIPALGAETVKAGGGSAPMTEAEREAKIESLLSYYNALYEMKQNYGIADAWKNSSDEYANARIIVKTSHELDYTGSVAHVNGYNDWHVIQYETPAQAEAAAKEYSNLSYVEYVQADGIVSVDSVTTDEEPDDQPGTGYNYISWGWGVNYVNARDYNTWLYDKLGSDINNLPEITVAVIDTGVDSDHAMLVDRLVPGGYDFIDNDADPEDEHSHGTHVAGTIIDGTLPNVKIMGIRVLDAEGYGDDTQVAAGMEWAYLHGCIVANMSLGGDCDHSTWHNTYVEIIDAAAEYGCVFCIAAGNEYGDDANNHCPGNVPLAITVAAHDSGNNLANFSNIGDIVDITAPGVDIVSARMGGGTTSKSGTSMATPHVAGVCAMIKSLDPNMGVEEITNIIKSNAKPASFSGGGAGLLCVTNILKFYGLNIGDTRISFNSNAPYAWTMLEDGIAVSGNAGVNSSTSLLTGTVTTLPYQQITFEYKVSSQNGDYLEFKVGDESMMTAAASDNWQTFSCVIPGDGENVLSWAFIKDAGGSAGDDCAYIRNVEITDTISTVINAPGSCFEFISEGAYPWVIDGGAVKSGNAGVNSSVSAMTMTAELSEGVLINFNYKVDAASGDNFTFRLNGQTLIDTNSQPEFTSFQYQVPAEGTYSFEFTFTKDGSGSSGSDCAWVKEFALGHTMNSALNVPGGHLEFESPSQTYPWRVENDYLVSGNAGYHSTTSYFQITLVLEAGDTLSFDYKVSSESGWDKFYFYVGNTAVVTADGIVGWTHYTYTVPSNGTYTFKWAYTKDGSVNRNDDEACVDNVELVRVHNAPSGDVDGNGVVNMTDAVLTMRYVLGYLTENDLNIAEADMNEDGTVDMSDVTIIARIGLGMS